uniref:Uncharacterized protein n=1 Tax=Stomoxys calcitrans TaxID=35570 RepID=A0A1I8NYE9_STOCA
MLMFNCIWSSILFIFIFSNAQNCIFGNMLGDRKMPSSIKPTWAERNQKPIAISPINELSKTAPYPNKLNTIIKSAKQSSQVALQNFGVTYPNPIVDGVGQKHLLESFQTTLKQQKQSSLSKRKEKELQEKKINDFFQNVLMNRKMRVPNNKNKLNNKIKAAMQRSKDSLHKMGVPSHSAIFDEDSQKQLLQFYKQILKRQSDHPDNDDDDDGEYNIKRFHLAVMRNCAKVINNRCAAARKKNFRKLV